MLPNIRAFQAQLYILLVYDYLLLLLLLTPKGHDIIRCVVENLLNGNLSLLSTQIRAYELVYKKKNIVLCQPRFKSKKWHWERYFTCLVYQSSDLPTLFFNLRCKPFHNRLTSIIVTMPVKVSRKLTYYSGSLRLPAPVAKIRGLRVG